MVSCFCFLLWPHDACSRLIGAGSDEGLVVKLVVRLKVERVVITMFVQSPQERPSNKSLKAPFSFGEDWI